ncbi:MAG: hypothetical protein P8171_23360 [Candidatus Thiodiazotropha sp.]
MTYNTTQNETDASRIRRTPALLDGLITLSGLVIATGSFFNAEITMWWLGA